MNVALIQEKYARFVTITITYRLLQDGVWMLEKKTLHSQNDADTFIYNLSTDFTKRLVHIEKKTTIYEEHVPVS